jgi:hypothetical protein
MIENASMTFQALLVKTRITLSAGRHVASWIALGVGLVLSIVASLEVKEGILLASSSVSNTAPNRE